MALVTNSFNSVIYDFVAKARTAVSRLASDELFEDFIKACAKAIHEAEVWPASPQRICSELILTCNYLLASLYHQCTTGAVQARADSRDAQDILLHSLERVSLCLSSPHPANKCTTPGRSTNGSVLEKVLEIISSLENPIIHFLEWLKIVGGLIFNFMSTKLGSNKAPEESSNQDSKSLAFMGRLFVLVCIWCVYCWNRGEGRVEEVHSLLSRMKQLSNGSVLKECLPEYHGLFLNSPSCNDGGHSGQAGTTPCVEDLMSLVFVSFELPCNLAMEHEPWQWLHCFLTCKQSMRENNYIAAMSGLSSTLKMDIDPENKARLLCLFAECYHKQGCPQLAVQAYRDALQVSSDCPSALWGLSAVFQALGQGDLELECLNLLSSMLANTAEDSQKPRPHFSLDEIVWCAFSPLTNVTLPVAMYRFAKRCFQLERYKESAEQYYALISHLKPGGPFQELFDTSRFEVDVREVFVEAAEALLVAQRVKDCLAISGHLCSCLLVGESFQPQGQVLDPFDDDNNSSPLFLSRDTSFHDSSESVRPFGARDATGRGPSSDLSAQNELSEWGLLLTAGTRKRQRSEDTKLEGETLAMDKEHLLTARALICKSHALIKAGGHTDQSMACLSQAMDVLLSHPSHLKSKRSPTQSPESKRQRVGSEDGHCSRLATDEPSSHVAGTDIWSRLTLDTAIQMAKASWEGKRFASVMNSCNLALQLDPENIQACYLKTLVLMENQSTKKRSAREWLHRRGITDVEDLVKSQAMSHEGKEPKKSLTKRDEKWFEISVEEMRNLDLLCGQYLLNSRQNDTQD